MIPIKGFGDLFVDGTKYSVMRVSDSQYNIRAYSLGASMTTFPIAPPHITATVIDDKVDITGLKDDSVIEAFKTAMNSLIGIQP